MITIMSIVVTPRGLRYVAPQGISGRNRTRHRDLFAAAPTRLYSATNSGASYDPVAQLVSDTPQ